MAARLCLLIQRLRNEIIMLLTAQSLVGALGRVFVSFITALYSIYGAEHISRLGRIKESWFCCRRVNGGRHGTQISVREKFTQTGTGAGGHTHARCEARPRGGLYVVMCFRLGLCVQRWWAGEQMDRSLFPGLPAFCLPHSPANSTVPISLLHFYTPSATPLTFHLYCFTPSCCVIKSSPPTRPPSHSLSPPLDLFLPSLPQRPLAEIGCLPNWGLIPWFFFM